MVWEVEVMCKLRPQGKGNHIMIVGTGGGLNQLIVKGKRGRLIS